ncbi:MAG: tripartite tricarboxylate transporter TctB family protein [Chloroflexota bacterium]|nr:tripartite tricarboxylate transporter TctB family protein [Chloroflexota bacterium]
MDQITAIVMLIFSLLVIEESAKMALFVEFAPGYGFLPFWLGVFMAILSVLLFVDAKRRSGLTDSPQPFPKKAAFMSILIALAAVGFYALFLEFLGYIITTLVTVYLLLAVMEKEDWRKTLVISVIITASLYLLFQVWLGVGLPKNMFGF